MSTAMRVLTGAGLAILVGVGVYVRPLLQDPDLPRKPWGWKLGEATEEGELTYRMMCQTCHGENGDGKGPSAVTLATQPRDFTDRDYMKKRSDWRIYHTIRDGGEAVGLSSAMPSWKDAVPEEQILEVAAFIRRFSDRDPPPAR